jgi:hypothetical protein
MPRWWRVGFTAVLVVTVGAQMTRWALLDPFWEGQHEAVVADYTDAYSLNWHWSENEECLQFDRCVFIEVDETQLCEDQLQIDVWLTDKDDEWVADGEMIVESPRQSGRAQIEVGANREDFEFFLVGDVWCYSGVPTAEAFI